MYNWFIDKQQIISKTINAVMGEFDGLINACDTSANYWLDPTHNIFAFLHDNGRDDKWIEIHYELYGHDEQNDEVEIIGDLLVLESESTKRESVLREVSVIVESYFGG